MSWIQNVKRWIRRQELQLELRRSQAFQAECQKLRCANLAELEQRYRANLAEKLRQLD